MKILKLSDFDNESDVEAIAYFNIIIKSDVILRRKLMTNPFKKKFSKLVNIVRS